MVVKIFRKRDIGRIKKGREKGVREIGGGGGDRCKSMVNSQLGFSQLVI